ncbi:hypothetical protein [Litoreibacter arenae]|uniref:hypothetical protein n=1 Tax=Litoreibacter arenae TaxID=491388 RepID=UPI001FE14703|nr:hypothetical protein [Litoreibacter arenae]
MTNALAETTRSALGCIVTRPAMITAAMFPQTKPNAAFCAVVKVARTKRPEFDETKAQTPDGLATNTLSEKTWAAPPQSEIATRAVMNPAHICI